MQFYYSTSAPKGKRDFRYLKKIIAESIAAEKLKSRDLKWGCRNLTGFRGQVEVAKSSSLCYACIRKELYQAKHDRDINAAKNILAEGFRQWVVHNRRDHVIKAAVKC